ncbi:MAG: shikimate dehydrogenase, partial [Bacteroidales bacterium]
MKKYGLIGYPLSHSFSQRYFTDKFEKEQIDAVYDNYSLSDIDQ